MVSLESFFLPMSLLGGGGLYVGDWGSLLPTTLVYLGSPIIHKGRVGNAFNFILDKVQSKLAGWKSRLLSKLGRLVLAKSAATPIAEYYI